MLKYQNLIGQKRTRRRVQERMLGKLFDIERGGATYQNKALTAFDYTKVANTSVEAGL